MKNSVYNWLVQEGNIIIQKKSDCISLQVEANQKCLLNPKDTSETITILTKIAAEIWKNPNYKKVPYTKTLFTLKNRKYSWQINKSTLELSCDSVQKNVEIIVNGEEILDIEVNYIVEIIQILEKFNHSFKL